MIPLDLGNKHIAEVFLQFKKKNWENKMATFREFKAFFINDVEEIKKYLKIYGKNQYSDKFWDRVRLRHKDLTNKTLDKQVAGIIDQPPVREWYIGDKVLPDFATYIDIWDFNRKMKKALKAALYFNTIMTVAKWDEKKERVIIDILTPADFDVSTDPEDFYNMQKLYYPVADGDGNILVVVWTEDDHYLIDQNGNEIRRVNDRVLTNPYGLLPAKELRINEDGQDFFGEPNWNLLEAQKEIDLKHTNFNNTEEMQAFGVWFGVNIGKDTELTFTPGEVFKVEDSRTEMKDPSLQCIVPQVDFKALRENLDAEEKSILMNQGFSGSSTDTKTIQLSGVSKGYDEIGIEEIREDLRAILMDFEKEFIKICVTVHNAHAKDKIPEGEYSVKYQEEKNAESVDDKIKRRKMESEYGLADAIDFLMQDYGMSEEDAIAELEKRKERKSQLGTNTDLFSRLRNDSRTSTE